MQNLPKPSYQKISVDPTFPVRAVTMHSENSRDLIYSHWHPFIEIIHITKGQVLMTIDKKQVQFNTGDICILNPNQVHFGNAPNGVDSEVELVVLSYDILPHQHSDSIYQKYILPLKNGDMLLPQVILSNNKINNIPFWQEECHGLLCRLIKYGGKGFAGREIAIQGVFMELLSVMYHHSCLISTKTDQKNQIRPRDMEILDYVENNFTASLSVPDIANHFGINEDYFYRIFKTTTGLTPITFIHQLRLRYAKQLLKNTDLSMTEISDRIGFNSSSYFSKLFSRNNGMTPTQYRSNL